MNNIVLKPKFASGEIIVPSSKSIAHRALIIAALSGNEVAVNGIDISDDINATIDALKQIGVSIIFSDGKILINGSNLKRNSNVKINAKESGSTLRFMIPVVIQLGNDAEFTGEGRLPKRPLNDYFNLFSETGISYHTEKESNLPLRVSGNADFKDVKINGGISSQFITGIMLCGMIKPVKITILGEIQSKPYINITADVLRKFGCDVKFDGNICYVNRNYNKITNEYTVEKDWSQAAFFLCAGAVNGKITVNNINIHSTQGDSKILKVLEDFGAKTEIGNNSVTVYKSDMHGIKVDASDIPDLVPVIAVTACFAKGETIIYNAERLRLKESDRLQAIYNELKILGANIEITNDGLKIKGVNTLKGGEVNSHNDHRIAMSVAVASLRCAGDVILNGYNAVNKSYPLFFKDWSEI